MCIIADVKPYDPWMNMVDSKPLTLNYEKCSHYKIYSENFNKYCINCKSYNVTTYYNNIYKIYNTFKEEEVFYYKNKCVACKIEWYNINISYCSICNGAMINIDSNLNKCICTEKIKHINEKKHIIYATKLIEKSIQLKSTISLIPVGLYKRSWKSYVKPTICKMSDKLISSNSNEPRQKPNVLIYSVNSNTIELSQNKLVKSRLFMKLKKYLCCF